MSPPQRPQVLIVGDVFTDVVVKPEGPLVTGADRRAVIRMLPGGSGANQAAWLAAEGVRVVFAGRVGASDHAEQSRLLATAGVEPVLARDEAVATGLIVSVIGPDGERSFYTDRGANARLCRADLPDTLLDNVDLLHLSGYAFFDTGARVAVTALVAAAAARGIHVSVDPPSTAFLEEIGVENFLGWTKGARICLPNAAEAAVLARSDNVATQLTVLGGSYELAVIKRGADGAVAGDSAGRRWKARTARVETVDSSGAGDAFLAGFLAELLRSGDIDACLQRGIETGARAVTTLGARPSRALPMLDAER
jgi:sugar/nucleoside kinase (ribokinase family)